MSQSDHDSQPSRGASRRSEQVNEIMNKYKKQRETSKREVTQRQKARTNQLRDNIGSYFWKYDDKVRTIRRQKLQILLDLFQQEREIMEKIDKSQAALNNACLSAARTLDAAFAERIKHLGQ